MAPSSQLDPGQIIKRIFDDSADAIRVELDSDILVGDIGIAGKTAIGHARKDYSSGSVTTSAYVEIVSATASEAQELEIFDSSGETLVLAFGAAASEVDKIYIFPGGNGRVPLNIPSGTRLSIKAVSATASSGELSINIYG